MKQVKLTVRSNEPIAKSVYKMTLTGDLSAVTVPGQFVNIQLDGLYLRRPISVCDCADGVLTLIYKVVGKGTAQMAGMTGGEVLDVEVGVVDGTGKLELTGNLGSVMQESCKAAITYIRSRADKLGIDPHFNQKKDIHIHFPEGAVPKDGPSAGITICIGVISALTGIPVRRDLAMTGEITLRGRILPIGGLKEKTMAALRAGVSTVIIPAENEPDLDEIDQSVRERLKFVTADHVDAILDIALNRRAVEQEKEAPAPELPAQTPPPGVMPEAGARIGQ